MLENQVKLHRKTLGCEISYPFGQKLQESVVSARGLKFKIFVNPVNLRASRASFLVSTARSCAKANI